MQASKPNRKDIRWKGFDYTSERYYFITVNVHDGRHLLGEVEEGEMRCNAAGEMVYEAVYQIPERYEGTEIEDVMIMPNHIHFMLYNGGGYHIPDIMRWFKSVTTNRYIHGVKERGWAPFHNTLWQRNYFDRVVRDQNEFDNVKRYIEENPQRWQIF